MSNEKVFAMPLSKVYPLLVAKAERKGRTRDEVDAVTCWLTGYEPAALSAQLARDIDYGTFFREAPQPNPKASQITGKICGVRIETIDDPLMRQIRQLDTARRRPRQRQAPGKDPAPGKENCHDHDL